MSCRAAYRFHSNWLLNWEHSSFNVSTNCRDTQLIFCRQYVVGTQSYTAPLHSTGIHTIYRYIFVKWPMIYGDFCVSFYFPRSFSASSSPFYQFSLSLFNFAIFFCSLFLIRSEKLCAQRARHRCFETESIFNACTVARTQTFTPYSFFLSRH